MVIEWDIDSGDEMESMKCVNMYFFFLMIRRPPRSTQSRSSAASDVYKRQSLSLSTDPGRRLPGPAV